MLRGKKLGEGTFGIVYSAKSPKSKSEYAVKRNLIEDETSFIGATREVDMLNKMRNHPNIVRLEKVAFDNPFTNKLFSPLVGKDRISQRNDKIHFIFKKADYDLHRYIYGSTSTDWHLTKKYMIDILLGVEYMHSQRIIHRDLKPSNILIFINEPNSFGFNNVAKICDFGLAKPYTYQGIQTPNTVTSWYRAPEITLGYDCYDYKIDVWSVGCILFEMVAKRAFIPDVSDNDDEILSAILGNLPQELPMRKFRELVKSNKWRKIRLRNTHKPRARKSFKTQINFNESGKQVFEQQMGSTLDLFCDLLTNMLMFDWETRFTITQCLHHKFFDDHRDLIDGAYNKYSSQKPKEYPYNIKTCIERKWMALAATEVFNNRSELKWYTHRALFQAMDLFDRYLMVMSNTNEIPKYAIESEFKGLIHDKFNTDLRFMTCLYLCIKYFSSIHYPISFESIVTSQFRTKDAKLIAEKFEGGFIKNCLEYDIYQPTLYETADDFNDKLTDIEVRDLIILYSMNNSLSGLTPTQVYQYYRDHFKGRDLEILFQPIVISPNNDQTTIDQSTNVEPNTNAQLQNDEQPTNVGLNSNTNT